MDTGVDYNHQDLTAKMWSAPQSFKSGSMTCPAGSHGIDLFNDTCDPMDHESHGTAVAGVAAADSNNGIGITGVSWTSPIMAVKFNELGSALDLYLSFGIDWAVSEGAKIINISYGGPTNDDPAILAEIDYAVTAGRVVVAAAGNDFCSQPSYPAAWAASSTTSVGGQTFNTSALISVGGVDYSSNVAIVGPGSFCNAEGSNFGPWVNVYAPWYATTTSAHIGYASDPGGYEAVGGTSVAAPYVSGTAALVWAANPTLSAADVKNTILAGAVSIFGNLDPLGNQFKVLDVFNAVFQAAAQHCTACPQAPEVIIDAAAATVNVGVPRGPNDTQNISVHGISIPLAPISSTNAAAAFYPPYYQVTFVYAFNSWDSYKCCSPRPGGWFDSFSVSTSTAPYWEMGLQDPIPELSPLPVLQPVCPVASFPGLSYINCPLVASFLIGGSAAGTLFQSLGGCLSSKLQVRFYWEVNMEGRP